MLKVTGIVLLLLIGLILLYFLMAYLLSRMTVPKEAGAKEEIGIYIKSNGVHTDLVVPVRNELMDWSGQVAFANTRANDTNYQYMGMGWGDKGFYLETPNWSDLKFSVAFKAAFGLSTTAIHATFYNDLQEGARCRKIVISKEQYQRLCTYILNSFARDEQGHSILIPTNANYSDADAFYEANGTYHLFQTCNTWANSGLKACGQKCCVWTAFDTGIFLKYK